MSGSDVIRFKLTVAYDGTGYAGWQVQKGQMGVQQLVEEALRKLFPSVNRIHSSSRTDAGVHAMGMVAHVDLVRAEFNMEVRKLTLALNSFLPEDIRVVRAVCARAGFHARFDAKGKEYRYIVWNPSIECSLFTSRDNHSRGRSRCAIMEMLKHQSAFDVRLGVALNTVGAWFIGEILKYIFKSKG